MCRFFVARRLQRVRNGARMVRARMPLPLTLSAGPDRYYPYYQSRRRTALQLAAREGHAALVELLLSHGAGACAAKTGPVAPRAAQSADYSALPNSRLVILG